MSNNWSLKELYTSFTSKEFIEDLNKVDNEIKNLKEFSQKLNSKNDIDYVLTSPIYLFCAYQLRYNLHVIYSSFCLLL